MKEKRNKTWLRKLVLIALCLTLTVISVPCPAQAADSDSKLEVTFLDVGQADAALIQCDGHSMLIDGGNAADSSKMYTVMKNHKITELDYVIGTHAHEDHIGGLAGALNYASVKTAYAPVTTYDSKAFQNFRKAVEKHGVSLTVPKKDETFSLGSAECKILAVNSESDTNNTSIVLRITYVLNTNTKKFHIPTCRSVKQMKDKNKKDFCGSREEVIAKGYSPCKICNP